LAVTFADGFLAAFLTCFVAGLEEVVGVVAAERTAVIVLLLEANGSSPDNATNGRPGRDTMSERNDRAEERCRVLARGHFA
jgi:hypothetical protein